MLGAVFYLSLAIQLLGADARQPPAQPHQFASLPSVTHRLQASPISRSFPLAREQDSTLGDLRLTERRDYRLARWETRLRLRVGGNRAPASSVAWGHPLGRQPRIGTVPRPITSLPPPTPMG